ncbi:hypothetical protein GQ44DRAFT_832798 [Phaeosphaeriaceae sp. PMI808]|nr:hypothetical protein GQ44DRAFT_832798 [Phaeosphaeriaceae sp. PMI808]
MPANAKDRSPSKRMRTPSPRKRGKYIPDDVENQLETLRAGPHLLPHCFDPPSSYQEACPVKRVAALQDVGSRIFYQELSDNGAELGAEGRKLFWLLQDSSLGVAVLPVALEAELPPELERIRPYQIDKADSRSRDELLAGLDAVRQINGASWRCVKDSKSEPE